MSSLRLAFLAAAFPTLALAQDAVEADEPVSPGAVEAVDPAAAEEVQGGPYIRADDVEDSRVYSVGESYDETFWDSGEPFGPVAAEWGDVGEVEDLLIDNAGNVVGVTVDVGGFLGIGERTVLVPIEDMRLVQRPDDDDEFYIVTRYSDEQLGEAAEVENVIGDD